MRYADGGGLTARGRAKHQAVRLSAAELFAKGMTQVQVAKHLRISKMSASRWYRAWKAGGTAALVLQGPGGATCRLDQEQLARLQAELERGRAAHGWSEDQRWTLPRIRQLIAELFDVEYSLPGIWRVLDRLGYSPQVPLHRAAERDEAAITAWKEHLWPDLKRR
jgi:transposase